jgi:hypothetical protein
VPQKKTAQDKKTVQIVALGNEKFSITQDMLQIDEETTTEVVERNRSLGLGTTQGPNKGIV